MPSLYRSDVQLLCSGTVGALSLIRYSLAVCAGEGGGAEATQDGPVALEVAVTILEIAHHHDRDVGDPQVDVGAWQPVWPLTLHKTSDV